MPTPLVRADCFVRSGLKSRLLNLGLIGTIVLTLASAACATTSQLVEVLRDGQHRGLRTRPAGQAASSPHKPALLILAIDGLSRDLVYSMLRAGELPELGALLGQGAAGFAHAYFADDVLTTLPTTTGAAWATIFTGVVPAQHGFVGNEFFVRETKEFAAPIPVTVHASAAALSVFTEGYANGLLKAPTIYETMRSRDPAINIWVSMSQFYAGADQLLMTRHSAMVAALKASLEGRSAKNLPRKVWQDLDQEDIEVVVERLRHEPPPDVLTIYLVGADEWAHVAPEGPDAARTGYLREVIDPAVGSLRRRLTDLHALDNRFVVLVSDHGHTEVVKDAAHALWTDDTDDPPEVLRKAHFRVRPFEEDVKASDPFQSVLAYQGALAYVYLADRSSCPDTSHACDWVRPPRYEQDVLPAAEAFYRNNLDGSLSPGMKGTLDLVLTRRPVPTGHSTRPFEVYVGNGATQPIDDYLRGSPHSTYIAVASRLRELAVGVHGDRAGDVLLLAHNGDRERAQDRYYFAAPYHSWHGSPSVQDSRIPLIVAHANKSTEELRELVRSYLGEEPHAKEVGTLLVGLREGQPSKKSHSVSSVRSRAAPRARKAQSFTVPDDEAR
ncbi:MAG: phosphodiesterase [Myxococcaceae bacterium]|nr:phosphodiesterase [Myxococcaceae bacterium]